MNRVHADPHNFGQQVTLEVGPKGRSIYRKPRPIFWEWLFFGSNSPLCPILSQRELVVHLHNGNLIKIGSIADNALGLEVEFTDAQRGFGYSFAVKHAKGYSEVASDIKLAQFGVVLAYCYVLGIQDIHYQNIIHALERPQVVDAEIVLSKLFLPDETLLLPFGDHTWDHAGVSQYIAKKDALTVDQVQAILSGFAAAMTELEQVAPSLLSVIEQEISARPPIPIRVILRDTFRYHAGSAGSPNHPLIPEETNQTKRGDIPYFFKFLESNSLYYYISKEGTYAEVVVPSHFQDAVKRVAVDPEQLLNPKRIGAELLPTGLLQICRNLISLNWEGILEFGSNCVSLTENMISISLPTGSFQSRRKRSTSR